ncbi:MBL fold metallo-hydrolase [Pontibacter korlensis]|uniref:Beta-lactamase n=1 Tax=Pontibacter korlensis TaxID=400092 RepID=A0A0E3ZGW5_9BACT|nr:MBL fold metallo-hydrolase [Pontibacter korlensis]AKD05163.1 beta-lactamase [Pontibacter korlensis]
MKLSRANQANICNTCGTRFSTAKTNQELCCICSDDRQFVPPQGQQWITYEQLAKERNILFSQLQPQLYDLRITPAFAIGQKAHLVLSPGGNILWDCLPLLDAQTHAYIQSLGGLKAIAISHPHFYSLMAEWAEAFDCPIYLHENDREWLKDSSPHIETFSPERKELWDDISIVHVGGHFPGSTVLHLPHHGHAGTLLTGDSILVVQDKNRVTFMYSYPNMIPLPKRDIEQIWERVKVLKFDTLHAAFKGSGIEKGAKEVVEKSAKRYLEIFTP